MTNGMCLRIKAFALSGRWDVMSYYPGRCPGLWDCWAFSPPLLRSVSGVGPSARFCYALSLGLGFQPALYVTIGLSAL